MAPNVVRVENAASVEAPFSSFIGNIKLTIHHPLELQISIPYYKGTRTAI